MDFLYNSSEVFTQGRSEYGSSSRTLALLHIPSDCHWALYIQFSSLWLNYDGLDDPIQLISQDSFKDDSHHLSEQSFVTFCNALITCIAEIASSQSFINFDHELRSILSLSYLKNWLKSGQISSATAANFYL